jgi:hypothetical protein
MNQAIVEAIQNKKQLAIEYKGALRVVDPHAYGIDKNGELKLRAYQTNNDGDASKVEGWRLFDETKITMLTVLPSTSTIREGYNPADAVFVNTIANV